MPAHPLPLWVTVLSPVHSYSIVTPNPSRPQQLPGAGCVPWVWEGLRGAGRVAQALVLWCPQRAHHATGVCLEARDRADVVQEGQTVLGELWVLPEHKLLPYPQGLEPTPARGTGRGVEEPAVLRCGFGVGQ